MTELHKRMRREFFDSIITPVGDCPDGAAFTGLVSSAGYAVYFREAACARESIQLPPGAEHAKILCGSGIVEDAQLKLPPCGYIILKW
jgi:hypothetical protein